MLSMLKIGCALALLMASETLLSMQTNGDITAAYSSILQQQLPSVIIQIITQYLVGSSYRLDPALFDKQITHCTVNNSGHVIGTTREFIFVWNPWDGSYNQHKIHKGRYVDCITGENVVLVEANEKKTGYSLTVFRDSKLDAVRIFPFQHYCSRVFEVSGDGSTIYSAQSPTVSQQPIKKILVQRMLIKDIVEKTINVPKKGCIPPLVVSDDGLYVGAYDVATLALILWRFPEPNVHRRFKALNTPSKFEFSYVSMRMPTKSMKEHQFYWLTVKNAQISCYEIEANSVINQSSIMGPRGDVLLGSKIIGDFVRMAIIKSLKKKDEYNLSMCISRFNIATTSSLQCDIPLARNYVYGSVVHSNIGFLQACHIAGKEMISIKFDGDQCDTLGLPLNTSQNDDNYYHRYMLSSNGNFGIIGQSVYNFGGDTYSSDSARLSLPQELQRILNLK